jgi:LPS export ABC transporter protein LptC
MYASLPELFISPSRSVGLITAVVTILAFPGCVNDAEEIQQAVRKGPAPVEVSEQIEVLYSDSAIVKVKMEAPLLERYLVPEPYIELRKGVTLTFYDKNRNVSSRLTAGYAISREKDRLMEAKQDVVVINSDGDKLNTEHLVWDEYTRKIRSDVFAKITTANEIIYGNGMEANEDFTRYKIKDVKGVINLKKPKDAKDS